MRQTGLRPFESIRRPADGFSLIEMMGVLALLLVVTAMAVPLTERAVAGARTGGNARGLADYVSLAKMRAASDFTHARVFVDLAGNTYYLQTWDKTGGSWQTQGGQQTLSSGVSFGFGSVTSAPPNTQGTLGQAPACRDDLGTAIGNTACIVFNSRGVPIDAAGTPTGDDAIYLTDGTAVYGTTVSATGMSRFWWSPANNTAWTNQ